MEELEPDPGPGYDRLDSEDHRGTSWRDHKLPIAVAAATIVAVTPRGRRPGRPGARNDEKQRQSALAESALVVSADRRSALRRGRAPSDVAYVTQRVDLAVVNGGLAPPDDVI